MEDMEIDQNSSVARHAIKTEQKGRLSRGRRSMNHNLFVDAEKGELYKDIPMHLDPSVRLEMLVRKSIQFAFESCFPVDQGAAKFMEVKDAVEATIEKMRTDNLFVEHTCSTKGPCTMKQPDCEDEATKKVQESLTKLEKENDRWETQLKKYRAMDKPSAVENAAVVPNLPLTANAEASESQKRKSHFTDELKKLDSHNQKVLLQMKAFKQITLEMVNVKKQVGNTVDSLAGELYKDMHSRDDVKDVVTSLLQ